jgi:hypothetical protein
MITALLTPNKRQLLEALVRPAGFQPGFFGGADRDRTGDPLLAKQVLSQLSYSPIAGSTAKKWWAWVESNYRPHPYQGCALAS